MNPIRRAPPRAYDISVAAVEADEMARGLINVPDTTRTPGRASASAYNTRSTFVVQDEAQRGTISITDFARTPARAPVEAYWRHNPQPPVDNDMPAGAVHSSFVQQYPPARMAAPSAYDIERVGVPPDELSVPDGARRTILSQPLTLAGRAAMSEYWIPPRAIYLEDVPQPYTQLLPTVARAAVLAPL